MKNIEEMYLELLKKTLTSTIHEEVYKYLPIWNDNSTIYFKLLNFINRMLGIKKFALVKIYPFEYAIEGRIWLNDAETMIGLKRLENIQLCIERILKDNVEGDFIETGVWRGGAVIFMKALLSIHDDNNRVVWCADSFEGLPVPNSELYPEEKGDKHYKIEQLAVSFEDVKKNFRKYNLLDDNVHFLKGWFKDTLPLAPIEKLALLRLDGDLYESTMDAFLYLYDKVSVGGYIIVDDYGALPQCKKAVDDFRYRRNIIDEIINIDGSGVYWRKTV